MVDVTDSDPGFVRGQIPNAAQWNSYFAEKVDTVNGDLTTPNVTGGIFAGDPSFTGAPTFPGGGVFSGGTWGGALTLSGSGTALAVTNNATVGGTLGVTGAATVGGTLGVTGALSVTSNATVNGKLGLDTAATGGVPFMLLHSDGGNLNVLADAWADDDGFGLNFQVQGSRSAEEYWGVTGAVPGVGPSMKAYGVDLTADVRGIISAQNEGELWFGNDTGLVLKLVGPTGVPAENYVQLTSAYLGNTARVTAMGEASASLSLVASGSGTVYARNANGVIATFTTALGGSVNYVAVTATTTGGLAAVTATGDANASLSVAASGTGTVFARNAGGTAAEMLAVASSVNRVRLTSSVTGGDPSVSSVGSDTDIGLILEPKGTGAIQATTDGDTRGTYARDWQGLRSTSTQVASGVNAVISGGNYNRASAAHTVIGGGQLNIADGTYSIIPGGFRADTRGQYGWFGFASGFFATEGDAQGGWFILRGTSIAGAAVRLTSNGGAIDAVAPGINSVLIGSQRFVSFTIQIVGQKTTGAVTVGNAYFNDVLIAKEGGGTVIIYVGGSPRTLGLTLPTVGITIGGEGLLNVTCTPGDADDWQFVAKLSTVEAT
jgi:hypothetical protein